MEDIGFYHAERGYWQATGGEADKLLPGYPEGTKVVPLRPGPDYTWNGETWDHVPVMPTRDELLARSMHERWLAEEAGVYVGGVMIDSSRDSQSMMSKAVRYLEEKPDGTVIDYKTGDGFAPFGLAELKAVSILVGDHVQACFTREKTVNAAIRAGTYTTYEQVVAAYADLYPTAGG